MLPVGQFLWRRRGGCGVPVLLGRGRLLLRLELGLLDGFRAVEVVAVVAHGRRLIVEVHSALVQRLLPLGVD